MIRRCASHPAGRAGARCLTAFDSNLRIEASHPSHGEKCGSVGGDKYGEDEMVAGEG